MIEVGKPVVPRADHRRMVGGPLFFVDTNVVADDLPAERLQRYSRWNRQQGSESLPVGMLRVCTKQLIPSNDGVRIAHIHDAQPCRSCAFSARDVVAIDAGTDTVVGKTKLNFDAINVCGHSGSKFLFWR